ncbi:RTA1-like protein [Coprinellus micaceus]|uniref:RTA1-like protein n=1 Tax=Coprinellus micaceus TaxID=71717 RepID=A0A4Y7SM39_COPMI|nr:RTA1-like protein [Coprinellus micaceus]
MSTVAGTPFEGIDPAEWSPYNYIPSQSAGIAMIAVFGLSTLLHFGVALWHRMWWILPTVVLCGALEVAGWGGRLWSYYQPWNGSPFELQICTTIIAPTPLLAAVFVIFGEVIRRLGSGYSRLSAKYYTIIFCTCDVIALIVQGVGGGLAATAADNGRDPTTGSRIMLGGIAFQLAVITIFAFCAAEYLVRYAWDVPVRSIKGSGAETERGEFTGKLKTMVSAIGFVTVVLFIRAIYRTIELTDGWNGVIISTERYFIVLDAVMIVLGMYALNIIHPWCFLFKDAALQRSTSTSSESD